MEKESSKDTNHWENDLIDIWTIKKILLSRFTYRKNHLPGFILRLLGNIYIDCLILYKKYKF